MKKIIDLKTEEQVNFNRENLPMYIHGRDHSGASLFSITVAANLHEAQNKLLIFTAFTMAKDEFLSQISDANKFYYIEDISKIAEAETYQTIMVESGNSELFMEVVASLQDINERIIFVKNIETVDQDITKFSEALLVSGDLDASPIKNKLLSINFKTKVLFSPFNNETLPVLEKYQACLKDPNGDKILGIK